MLPVGPPYFLSSRPEVRSSGAGGRWPIRVGDGVRGGRGGCKHGEMLPGCCGSTRVWTKAGLGSALARSQQLMQPEPPRQSRTKSHATVTVVPRWARPTGRATLLANIRSITAPELHQTQKERNGERCKLGEPSTRGSSESRPSG
eukprot:356604-Chlamydomonas_euryale.AAC.4